MSIVKPFYGIHTKPGMIIRITLDKVWEDKICVVLTITRKSSSPTVEIIGLIENKLVKFWLNNWNWYYCYVV